MVQQPARFQRAQFFHSSCDEAVRSFLGLFHRYGYIYKPVTGGSWLSANDSWQLTDTEILKAIACAHPKYILGCRAGRATRFAVIDIDAGSRYHNKTELNRILQTLSQGGLQHSVLYRSSDSGGWHLYLFFDEPVSSKDLRKQLFELFRLSGYVISKGTLEIFPHPGDASAGQGLRLPLQPGWAWLNEETLAARDDRLELSPAKALRKFLADLENEANTRHDFHRMRAYVEGLAARQEQVKIETTRNASSNNVIPLTRLKTIQAGDSAELAQAAFGQLPPNINAEDWAKGRTFYQHGLFAPSQRAEAIFCLSHYLFYGDPMFDIRPLGYGYEDEREWTIRQILELKHNGQSQEINKGTREAWSQAYRAAYWTPPSQLQKEEKSKPFKKLVPKAWERNNANREVDARKRIRKAIETLVASGEKFTVRDIRGQAGCSMETLYRHADIWQPFHHEANQKHLAVVTDEYNGVVGGCSQETAACPLPTHFDMPAGRLAARQIVDELRMRTERDKKNRQKQARQLSDGRFETWTSKVHELTASPPSALETKRLHAVIDALGFYLGLSPTEDDELMLRPKIQTYRDELASRTVGPETG